MTQWTDTHDKWRNQYEAWHSTPKNQVGDDELEDFRLRYAFFMHLLPEILDGLAMEAEGLGIDSTPIIDLRGSFATVWRKTIEFEKRMDKVLAIAQRIKLKPPQDAKETQADWREHTAADAMDALGIESRDTLSTHAKSIEHPYIQWVSRGRYKIDHSHEYVKRLAK